MKFKIEIFSEMTSGHGFTDVFYSDSYDSESIEDLVFTKAERRGFKREEVNDYKVQITNYI